MSEDDLWSATRPGSGSASAPPGWQPPGPPPPPPPRYETMPPGDGGGASRPPWFILALVLGVVAIGAGIWVIIAQGDEDQPPAAAPTAERSPATPPAVTSASPSVGTVADTAPPGPATSAATTVATVDFTLPAAPTDPSTTTEPPPSTAPPTSPPSSAPRTRRNPQRQLDVYLGSDYPVVEGLQGSWVVQLSAKRPGLEADGIVYEVSDVLANHAALRDEYGAVLAWSGDWVYDVTDLYITLIPTSYETGEEALDECRRLGFTDSDDCLAKKITTDRSDENTTEYLP